MSFSMMKIGMFSLILALSACGGASDKDHKAQSYTLSLKPWHKSLHFIGSVQPIHESSLVSPMDGVVHSMNFHYGQRVKKNDLLLTLNSSELQKQYNDNVTDYLKAKDSYSVAQAKFSGTQELWKSGLIAKNNYLSEQSNIATARLSLIQATGKLTELLQKIGDQSAQDLSALKLTDFDRIKAILSSQHNVIRLEAPSDGVMLYPPKSGQDKAKRINVGSAIKSGELIALIGNLKGLSIEIDVPEVDINSIHIGMPAEITGVAFGQHHLKGSLIAMNAQALNNSAGGLPSFTAIVEVPKLTKEEQAWIKVGMSASIELMADENKQLSVPIAALQREKGKTIVFVKTPKGTIEKKVITTGSSQGDYVLVETGLKEGDVVVYE